MSPEPTKHDASSHNTENQKTLDQEIRELISALTNRLGTIPRAHKPGGPTNHNQDDDDEQGVRIITLAGNNLGATMRGDNTDEKPVSLELKGLAQPEQEDFATFVNSNFQAINNSIMMGGSYKTNDPGVHLDISDYYEQSEVARGHHGRKERKNKRRSSKGDNHRHIEHSDKTSESDKGSES